MKYTVIYISVFFLSFSLSAQNDKFIHYDWKEQLPDEEIIPDWPSENGAEMQLPGWNQMWNVRIWYNPLYQKDFEGKFPEIRTYRIISERDHLSGWITVSPKGIHVIYRKSGVLYKMLPQENEDLYRLTRADKPTFAETGFECAVTEEGKPLPLEMRLQCVSNGSTLRTYEMAVVTTGEFYHENGDNITDVLTQIMFSMSGLNSIYENDLSITFIHAMNSPVVFTDSTTDPFDPSGNRLAQAEAVISDSFSVNDYDLGHVLHNTASGTWAGGGIASLGVVCATNHNKARGWSGSSTNATFSWIGLFAHEVGHMFNAQHTFNGNGNSCDVNNLSDNTSYEIGSGTTIMSYRGICAPNQNVPFTLPSSNYFHVNSLELITAFVNTESCETSSSTSNTIPTADANPFNLLYIIPQQTPFELIGEGTDPDGNSLTYKWEQYDEDGAGQHPTHGYIGSTAAQSALAPLFRAFPPDNDPSRTFPQLSDILNGDLTTDFEPLPQVARTITMRFIVRDNNTGAGAINCDEEMITVTSGGPFLITSQNAPVTWNSGSTYTIDWNTGGTAGSPINANLVNILFSTNGGQSFPYTLGTDVINDGTHDITAPSLSTTEGRIKIEPAGDYIFFTINQADITVTDDCNANAGTFSPDDDVIAEEGSDSLNLNHEDPLGDPTTSFSGDIQASDPQSAIGAEDNSMGTCTEVLTNPHYDLHTFSVTASGTYTFSNIPFPFVATIYEGSFDPNNVCDNWVASNADDRGTVFISGSFSASLTAQTVYRLRVSGFNSTDTGPYNISVSGPGTVLDGFPNPAGYTYTYVIVNESTGNIVDFDPNTDLTTYSTGSYTIYGLHYESSENLTPYEGGSFSTFLNDIVNGTICANISSNSRSVLIQPATPVELLSFSVTKDGENARLLWRTGVEINVKNFNIFRSDDGEAFIQLDFINAMGSYNSYAYTDTDPGTGNLYYKLKVMDRDGEYEWSPVRHISFRNGKEIALYPNPANDRIFISGAGKEFRIYDVTGKLLKEIETSAQSKAIFVGDLAPGIYFIRGEQEGRYRFIKR